MSKYSKAKSGLKGNCGHKARPKTSGGGMYKAKKKKSPVAKSATKKYVAKY